MTWVKKALIAGITGRDDSYLIEHLLSKAHDEALRTGSKIAGKRGLE